MMMTGLTIETRRQFGFETSCLSSAVTVCVWTIDIDIGIGIDIGIEELETQCYD
jgi:hypothetical protein